MSGLLPRMLGRKPIEYDLMRFKAGAGLDIPNPLYVYNVYPWADNTYDLGSQSLNFAAVHTINLYVHKSDDTTKYGRIYLEPAGGYAQGAIKIVSAEPTASEFDSSIAEIQAIGYQNDVADLSKIRVQSGAQATAHRVEFMFGSETTPYFYFFKTRMSMVGYIDCGGVNLTTGYYSTTLEDGVLMQGEAATPGNPTSNGVSKLWLSTAGDLMVKIREGGSTRSFTLASHGAGAGNNVFDEYLYHAGDLDTYIRFQDDQVSLAAGGAVFLDFTEAADDVLTLAGGAVTFATMTESGAGQHIIVVNPADADVDFRVDTTAGDGALFVQGSSGHVGVGFATSPDFIFDVRSATEDAIQIRGTAATAQNIIIDTVADYPGRLIWRHATVNQFWIDYDAAPSMDDRLGFYDVGAAAYAIVIDSLRVGMGEDTPTGKLHVNQYDVAGAIPVVHLEQDDVSEEFIRFTGTAAGAVLTQSLVDVGDAGTFTPVGYAKVNIQDEGNQITDGPYYVQFGTISA